MNKNSKTIVTIVLLAMALFQGLFFYYFTDGFIQLILLQPFELLGLSLTIVLLFTLIKYRSTNSRFHVIGLIIAFSFGIFISLGNGMEFLDFNLRMYERKKIVKEVINGPIKSGEIKDNSFLPLADGGSISFTKNNNGTVYVEFYIDRGFIDHYSAFVYTDDRQEIFNLEKGHKDFVSTVKKLRNNWYRIAN